MKDNRNASEREGNEDPRNDYDITVVMEAEGFRSLRGNAQNYKELNTYEKIIQLKKEGKTLEEIAKELKVSVGTVYNRLQESRGE